MQKLNATASTIFLAILGELKDDSHAKIQRGESYMPLCVEKLYSGLKVGTMTATVYSLAHYYEQNGDLMSDPDIEFAVVDNRTEEYPIIDLVGIYPMTFKQDNLGIYRSYTTIEDNEVKSYQVRAQKDCAAFCNQWLNNIKRQQQIKPLNIPNLRTFSKRTA